jgi:hypothetical protein
MRKVLLSLAAGLIMAATFASTADAQRGRGGPGVGRVGGPGFVGVRGGGFRTAGFVGGPRWAGGARWAGGPRWVGRRWVGRPGWGVRRAAFWGGVGVVGAYPYYAGYYGGCQRWRVVATPWGPQWRLVNVCYAPYGYGAYPAGYYGAGW